MERKEEKGGRERGRKEVEVTVMRGREIGSKKEWEEWKQAEKDRRE